MSRRVLTERNVSLVRVVLDGLTYKEAGAKFGISQGRAAGIYNHTLRVATSRAGIRNVDEFPAGYWEFKTYGVARDRANNGFFHSVLDRAVEAVKSPS